MHSTVEPLVVVTRGGVVESAHHGDVVVVSPDGQRTVLAGEATREVYPRSALKPFQALATLEQLADVGRTVTDDQVAVMSASHDGGDDPQVVAASLLAEADLDEGALRCPAAWPIDERVMADLDGPTTLSHNCSGKHAGMLLAHTAAGHDRVTYLEEASVLQRRIARWLADVFEVPPGGPAVDGCGAPTWRTTVAGLAMGFAKLAEGATPGLARVRDAMTAHPELVGGPTLHDTAMMRADARVVAKRGAEAVMGCGLLHPRLGPLGIAVKVHDGGDRAAGPAAAAVLEALGMVVPDHVRRTPVVGGGVRQGEVVATPGLAAATTAAFGLS